MVRISEIFVKINFESEIPLFKFRAGVVYRLEFFHKHVYGHTWALPCEGL